MNSESSLARLDVVDGADRAGHAFMFVGTIGEAPARIDARLAAVDFLLGLGADPYLWCGGVVGTRLHHADVVGGGEAHGVENAETVFGGAGGPRRPLV